MQVTLKQKDGQNVDVESSELMWVKKLSQRYPDANLKRTFCKKHNVFLKELEKALNSEQIVS